MFSRLAGVGEHTESALCISRTKELSLSASGQINEYGKIVSILYCKCNQMQKKGTGETSEADVGNSLAEMTGPRTAGGRRALQTFCNPSLRVV